MKKIAFLVTALIFSALLIGRAYAYGLPANVKYYKYGDKYMIYVLANVGDLPQKFNVSGYCKFYATFLDESNEAYYSTTLGYWNGTDFTDNINCTNPPYVITALSELVQPPSSIRYTLLLPNGTTYNTTYPFYLDAFPRISNLNLTEYNSTHVKLCFDGVVQRAFTTSYRIDVNTTQGVYTGSGLSGCFVLPKNSMLPVWLYNRIENYSAVVTSQTFYMRGFFGPTFNFTVNDLQITIPGSTLRNKTMFYISDVGRVVQVDSTDYNEYYLYTYFGSHFDENKLKPSVTKITDESKIVYNITFPDNLRTYIVVKIPKPSNWNGTIDYTSGFFNTTHVPFNYTVEDSYILLDPPVDSYATITLYEKPTSKGVSTTQKILLTVIPIELLAGTILAIINTFSMATRKVDPKRFITAIFVLALTTLLVIAFVEIIQGM